MIPTSGSGRIAFATAFLLFFGLTGIAIGAYVVSPWPGVVKPSAEPVPPLVDYRLAVLRSAEDWWMMRAEVASRASGVPLAAALYQVDALLASGHLVCESAPRGRVRLTERGLSERAALVTEGQGPKPATTMAPTKAVPVMPVDLPQSVDDGPGRPAGQDPVATPGVDPDLHNAAAGVEGLPPLGSGLPLADRLRAAREAARFSKSELARWLAADDNVSWTWQSIQPAIGKIEQGGQCPPSLRAAVIAFIADPPEPVLKTDLPSPAPAGELPAEVDRQVDGAASEVTYGLTATDGGHEGTRTPVGTVEPNQESADVGQIVIVDELAGETGSTGADDVPAAAVSAVEPEAVEAPPAEVPRAPDTAPTLGDLFDRVARLEVTAHAPVDLLPAIREAALGRTRPMDAELGGLRAKVQELESSARSSRSSTPNAPGCVANSATSTRS